MLLSATCILVLGITAAIASLCLTLWQFMCFPDDMIKNAYFPITDNQD